MEQQDTQRQNQNRSQRGYFQKEMTAPIITIYCLCADFLRMRRSRDDPQAR